MTRTLLVAPTGHGVGLTATCLGLVHALERQGVSVGFYKPLAQPRARGADQDRSTALVRLTLDPAAARADLRHPGGAGPARATSWTRCWRTSSPPPSRSSPSTTSWSSRGWCPGPASSTPDAPTSRWPRRWTPTCCSSGAPDGADGPRRTWPRRWRSPPAPTRAASAHRVVGAVVNRVPDLTPERSRRDPGAAGPPRPRPGRRGAVPPRAGLAAGLRRRRAASTSGCSTRASRTGGSRTVIVGAQAVPGILPAAARGAAAHRAGGPRRDHPQRLPRRDERHPLRRAAAHPRRRAGPAGLGAVPPGAAPRDCPSC